MKRYFSVIAMIVLILSLLAGMISCEEEPDLPPEEPPYSSKVNRLGGMCIHGDYIYQVVNGEVFRYHRETATRTYACLDPECDKTCLIHFATDFFGVYDDKLFFYANDYGYGEMGETVTHYAYQDLQTGEVKIVRSCEGNEVAAGRGIVVRDGYVYYIVSLLKEGGDPTYPADYWPTLCRTPIDGGAEEAMFQLSALNETMYDVWDGQLVTLCDGVVCSYDLDAPEKRELFNHDNTEYGTRPQNAAILDGKMYFIGKTREPIPNPVGPLYKQYLCVLDLTTGEVRRLIEAPIIHFTLMDDAVYYSKVDVRTVYEAQNEGEKTVYNQASAELYACDLNGENERVVFRHDTLKMTMLSFYIIDNVYYGWVSEFDEETHRYPGSVVFRKVDFATGEVISPNNAYENE